jgi:hypothetical protein
MFDAIAFALATSQGHLIHLCQSQHDLGSLSLPPRKPKGIMCGFWSEKREDVLGITVLVLLFVGLFLLVMFLFGFLWFDVDILAPLAT